MTFPIETVLRILQEELRGLKVPLVDLLAIQTQDPFKVLLATILSARTKDEVTAAAAQRLFARAETAPALARLAQQEIEELIYPVGFFRNKAKYLAALPKVLDHLFHGQVPDSVDELLKLPGVGRKTANLVVAVAFQKAALCVDTHVHRIMNIWGYVQTASPLATEMALREQLPGQYWLTVNTLLVTLGQSICKPRFPHCDRCGIVQLCPQIGVTPRKKAKTEPLASSTSSGLHCVSWNVNGLRAILQKGFLDILHDFDADIFALQEIKALPEQLPAEVRNPEGYHAFWHPAKKKGYAGVALFTKKHPLEIRYGLGVDAFDDEGRVLTLEFADFYCVTAYFPNAQDGLRRLQFKLDFNKAIVKYLNALAAHKTVLLCGDLNVAHQEIDLSNPKGNSKNPGFSPEERASMEEILQAGYVDTFRYFHPQAQRYTWWSYRSAARMRNIGWRIDYFLVDAKSLGRIRSANIHENVYGSDHCPVSVNLL
jgi:exodeoxyribonuclease-3